MRDRLLALIAIATFGYCAWVSITIVEQGASLASLEALAKDTEAKFAKHQLEEEGGVLCVIPGPDDSGKEEIR